MLAGCFVLMLAVLWGWRAWGTPPARPSRSLRRLVSTPRRTCRRLPLSRAENAGRRLAAIDRSSMRRVRVPRRIMRAISQPLSPSSRRRSKRTRRIADALSNLGQVLVKMNRPADAIPYLSRAASLAPDQWTYQFNLARALGLVGRLDESIQGVPRARRNCFPTIT